MMALLELTDIHMHDSIETGNGEYKIYQNILRDSKKGGFGRITIQEAFEKSSNIAMANWSSNILEIILQNLLILSQILE